MDFTNLRVEFNDDMSMPRTIYYFGRSRVEITFYMNKESDEYLLIYENNQETKLAEITEDLPKLFKIYVKRLYEAFDITSKDIESTIKSLQAWKRKCANNQ